MADRGAPFGVLSPGELGEQEPTFLDRIVAGIINGTVSIPKHVIDATKATAPGLRREDFTDIPATPAPFGLKIPGEQPGKDLYAGAADVALNLAGASLPFATPGSLGIFGGRMAVTADLNALQRAEKMAADGADRKAIWDETGWFKGGDGKWRFEIPDDKAVLNPNVYGSGEMPNRGDFGPIAAHLWHKDLYAAYPDARRATGFFERDTAGGSYQSAEHSPTGQETIKVQAKTVPDARSVALHEAQHLVQGREGFAQGGSPAYFTQAKDAETARDALSYRREIAKLDPSLTPKQKDDIIRKQYEEMGAPDWFPKAEARDWAHDIEGAPQNTLERLVSLYGLDKTTTPFAPRRLYHELPGEVEARNVQKRADMTPAERRATPPWMTEDITPRPIMNEIFGGGRVGSLEQGLQESRGYGGRGPYTGPSYEQLLGKQRATEGMRAAIRDPLTGKIYTGSSHQAAIDRAPQFKEGADEVANGTWGRMSREWDAGTENTGFVDAGGRFISRDEAEKRFGILTMEDLRDLRKGKRFR